MDHNKGERESSTSAHLVALTVMITVVSLYISVPFVPLSEHEDTADVSSLCHTL